MFQKLLHLFDYRKNHKPPIYFVTFHKTASSFFSRYVLGQTIGYTHKNIAKDIFEDKAVHKINLEEYGNMYGPIRLSLDVGPVYKKFVEPILEQKILQRHKAICFIRDPRDIIVSYFYSEAYSHVISSNPTISSIQLQRREHAIKIGLDQYAIEKADHLNEKFKLMADILQENANAVLLRYEDMIYDYDNFYKKLSDAIPLPLETKEMIFTYTRPRQGSNYSHRRSGERGNYIKELKPETIKVINEKLKANLDYFNYEYL